MVVRPSPTSRHIKLEKLGLQMCCYKLAERTCATCWPTTGRRCSSSVGRVGDHARRPPLLSSFESSVVFLT